MPNEAESRTKGIVVGLGMYLVVLNVTLIYSLIKIWPTDSPPPLMVEITFMYWPYTISLARETLYLLIVALSGALGSYVHLATSFADYVGNRRFVLSWTWYYLLRPFIGMALAVIVYFVLRGGFLLPNGNAASLSPYGVGAISGMAGMFSKQATDKLGEVFENMFKTDKPPERKDKLEKGEELKVETGSAS